MLGTITNLKNQAITITKITFAEWCVKRNVVITNAIRRRTTRNCIIL